MKRIGSLLFIIITALVIVVSLRFLGVNNYVNGVVTVMIIVILHIGIMLNRNIKLNNVLYKKCNPEVFLKRINSMNSRNIRYKRFLNVTKSTGLIAAGQFEEAESLLLSLNQDEVAAVNGLNEIYNINLATCLYELDKHEQAEALIDSELLSESETHNQLLRQSIDLLMAQRLFHLKQYDESKKLFSQIKEKSTVLSKLDFVTMEYYLARIEDLTGNESESIQKYQFVASQGNKLFVAKEARNYLAQLETN